MLLSIVVRQCMQTSVVSFRPETPVYEALDKILEYKISGGPVINDQKEILGMFSESDALRAILKMAYHEEEMSYAVGDFMCSPVDTVHENTGLVDVASLFIKDGRRRLPVVNEDNILVGQVSRRDILRAVREFQGKVTQ